MKYYSTSHDYSGRKIKKRKPKGEVYAKYSPPPFKPISTKPTSSYASLRMAESEKYPSRPISDPSPNGGCAKTEPQKYTGTLVKGISTLHKSNAVPILSQDEAKEHARMRR